MIYINFPFDEPSGGGNSFLNRLKKALLNNKKYSSLFNSKVIIFNSHHNVLSTVILKIFFRNKYFVHRVDGPMSLYTGKRDPRDEIVYEINKIADFTIFQSKWSYDKQIDFFKRKTKYQIISNGSKIVKNPIRNNKKTKIIIASWSDNLNKGFDIFSTLDEKINFNSFTVDFFGNSKINFKKIQKKGAIKFDHLEQEIKNYDLAIIASKNDPCSNFLIECINNDLDILSIKSGGHEELIENKDCLFGDMDDLLDKINNYKIGKYKNNLKHDINFISNKYIDLSDTLINNYKAKKINLGKLILIIISIMKLRYKFYKK